MKYFLAVVALFINPAFAGGSNVLDKHTASALLMANFVNGMCQAKLQSGLTTTDTMGKTSTAAVVLPREEKDQCDYVQLALKTRCLENKSCPDFDQWRKKRGSTD